MNDLSLTINMDDLFAAIKSGKATVAVSSAAEGMVLTINWPRTKDEPPTEKTN